MMRSHKSPSKIKYSTGIYRSQFVGDISSTKCIKMGHNFIILCLGLNTCESRFHVWASIFVFLIIEMRAGSDFELFDGFWFWKPLIHVIRAQAPIFEFWFWKTLIHVIRALARAGSDFWIFDSRGPYRGVGGYWW